MPIPIIGSLKLARGQKNGLISIFCLGAFVIAASIVRMVMLRSSARTQDPTWGSLEALVWTEIEANTSVICCCLPALRVPLMHLWHRLRGVDRSPTPTIDGPPRMTYDNAWTGPNRSHAFASRGLSRPQPSHQSHFSKGRTRLSHGKSSQSNSSGSRTRDTWYDRMLGTTGKEKDEVSRTGSEDELTRLSENDSTAPRLPLGAIYKTTDLHVSTQDLHRASTDPESGRRLSQRDAY